MPHNVIRGVLAIVCAMFALSLGDAIIKSISISFPLWQLYVLRSAIALPVLIAFIKIRHADLSLMPLSVGWTLTRSLLLAAMWIAYYAALPQLEFSVAAATLYTLPLFIMMFSALHVRETISKLGVGAIILGFTGVLVLLRPSVESFNLYVLLPIVAAVFYALAMVITRTKCQTESPYVLTFVLNLVFIAVGAVVTLGVLSADLDPQLVARNSFLLNDWIALDIRHLIALCVLALSILIGSIFVAFAYQIAPSSTIAAFDYSYLLFAAMWGILLFSETPDIWTILGIAMIACAGILVLRSDSH